MLLNSNLPPIHIYLLFNGNQIHSINKYIKCLFKSQSAEKFKQGNKIDTNLNFTVKRQILFYYFSDPPYLSSKDSNSYLASNLTHGMWFVNIESFLKSSL